MLDLQHDSHRRLNILTGEWVLVSPHRTSRPWQGQSDATPKASPLAHDPDCYLCPGTLRANGVRNPSYTDVFVFDNDFAALHADGSQDEVNFEGLVVAQGEPGICRVICYAPRHDLTLASMSASDIERIIACWRAEFLRLDRDPRIGAVQIFENRGGMMGASNPHPHGQVWATRREPNEIVKESERQRDHLAARGSCLLCDYLAFELEVGERVVYANEGFVALVPFWATWPFETLVLPRRHLAAFDDFTHDDQRALADLLSRLTRGYDALFETAFPYSMGFHQRPSRGGPHPHWHFHGHFYPPLLRSATIRKFMVGFELLGSPQRDITPESAADLLRVALSRR